MRKNDLRHLACWLGWNKSIQKKHNSICIDKHCFLRDLALEDEDEHRTKNQQIKKRFLEILDLMDNGN